MKLILKFTYSITNTLSLNSLMNIIMNSITKMVGLALHLFGRSLAYFAYIRDHSALILTFLRILIDLKKIFGYSILVVKGLLLLVWSLEGLELDSLVISYLLYLLEHPLALIIVLFLLL